MCAKEIVYISVTLLFNKYLTCFLKSPVTSKLYVEILHVLEMGICKLQFDRSDITTPSA